MRWILALGGFLLLPAISSARAQAPQSGTTANASAASHATVSSHTKSSSGSKKSAAEKTAGAPHSVHHTARRHPHPKAEVQPTPAPPAAPPRPVPPAEQPATPATIGFQQGLLSIRAQNSSLVAILDQISRQTGLVIEGLGHDERVYGQYGPDSVPNTLTALLDGAGYNYVIVGGGSDRSPGKLILTQNTGAPASSVPMAASSGAVAPVGNVTPPAVQNPSEPVRAKTPQEIFDELRKMHPQ